jgi:glutathione S-transferase
MKLYGTTTSPFVRRVRVVARELGVPVELVATPPNELADDISPIRKVPVAVLDGRTLFDSRAIIQYLLTTRGHGELAPPRDPWRESNLIHAADAALDSVVQVFYLKRDGLVATDDNVFTRRQFERAGAIYTWLATQLAPSQTTFGTGFGLAELSVICALDWMDFRQSYPTASATGLAALRAAHRERPSLVETRPHV